MKRQECGTRSCKQLPGPVIVGTERNRTGHIKSSRSIKPEPAEDAVFSTIRKEADDTLDAFQVERIRQVNTIDNMRQELRKLAGTSARLRCGAVMLSDRKGDTRPVLIRKQSVNLEEELKQTKKLLEEKEQALSKERSDNEKLRKENRILKDGKENIGVLMNMKKKLVKIICDITNDDSIDKLRGERSDSLLSRLEQAVKGIVKENRNIHLKYENLLELHNSLARKTKKTRDCSKEIYAETGEEKWGASRHLTIEIKTDSAQSILAKRRDSSLSILSSESKQVGGQVNVQPPSSPDETKSLRARILRLDSSIKTLESARSVNAGMYDVYPGTTRAYKSNIKLPIKKSYKY